MRWWAEPFSAKAVLILDGLSLRELPWLLQGAQERGFTTHEVAACASELPGETDEFARALGFALTFYPTVVMLFALVANFIWMAIAR